MYPEPIYKALARQPLYLGIPLIPLLLVGITGFSLALLIYMPAVVFVFLILYIMRSLCEKDEQLFHQLYLYWLLNYKSFPNTAQLCGINVRRVRILIFTLSGLLAAVTGILLAARLGSGNAGAANGLEFDVIAAVVVGGTALSGGRGSLFGTLLGVLVITLIGNGLVLLGINSFFQQVVRGVIIVVAVLANILLTQRSTFSD